MTTFRVRTTLAALLAAAFLAVTANPIQAGEKWSKEKAQAWGREHPWLSGCNYIPSTAINELEMWQADTFDPATIDRELGWAEGLGFNSVRVFLHNIPFEQDRDGFLKRIDQLLEIAARHKIGVMLVLFDAVWDPNPAPGKQREPKKGLHNSGWVQAPGRAILEDPGKQDQLEGYIKGVIGRFKDDQRVHVWDLFNEPDNTNGSSYGKEEPANKPRLCLELLKKEIAWARAVDPSQPLTSGVWIGDWAEEKLSPMGRLQLGDSDIISFHDYSKLPTLQKRVESLRRFERPILCTEYMARPAGSTFDPCLGFLREQQVAAYNWGFVDGKSQTIYPWDSWKKPYDAEPPVWFHDIFRRDGTPYDAKEVAYIRGVTGKSAPRAGRTVREGDTGDEVEAIQRSLNARLAPSPNLSVDGDFGTATREAVIRFQREKGLPPLGAVDARTREALGPPPAAKSDRDVPSPAVVNAETIAKAPPDPLDGPPFVGAKAVVVVDGKTGEVVWGKDEARTLEMASTTKMTTALIVARLAAKDPHVLDEVVTFSKRADDTSGSTAGVRVGENLPVRELLYGLLLPSGNDAATAFAEHFGGRFPKVDGPNGDDPLPRFVAEMNRVAAALNLKETHYTNPHGLPNADHHSSARDLAKIAREVVSDPTLAPVVATIRHGGTVEDGEGHKRNVVWSNTNSLLKVEGYDGVKTGTTGAAGSCLVASGRRGGDHLIVVALGAANTPARDADVRNLFRWAWGRRGHRGP
ncbi:MAG TPA: peptidoglycan-binding protein [Isosphaeraceae bacterium]